MKYLLFLSRFELDLIKLKSKIEGLGKNVSFNNTRAGLEVEADSLNVDKVIELQEIEKVIELKTGWKNLDFKSLKESSLKSLKNKKYKIQTKFYDKIPISSKSIIKQINPFLKFEGFKPTENEYEEMLLVELKREGTKKLYRLGVSKKEYWEKAKVVKVNMNFVIVLENPSLKEEVGDFLRLCHIFKLPLWIVTNERDFEKTLSKAKEETKGIDYQEFKMKVTATLPEGKLVGFSKHATKNESDLKEFFKKEKETIYLVFGDDKFGLTQGTRDRLNETFRLTPETKKPLRASHALSYILGFYTAEKI